MQGFASATLVGNLTRDVELKQTTGGTSVADVSIAVNMKYGEKESVSFFNCRLWGKTAEIASDWLKKGSPIMFVGRLEQQRWEDQAGNAQSKIVLQVEKMVFLPTGEKKADSGSGKRTPNPEPDDAETGLPGTQTSAPIADFDDADVPDFLK